MISCLIIFVVNHKLHLTFKRPVFYTVVTEQNFCIFSVRLHRLKSVGTSHQLDHLQFLQYLMLRRLAIVYES